MVAIFITDGIFQQVLGATDPVPNNINGEKCYKHK